MHEFYMRQALLLAREAAGAGEVPVGCVIVRGGEIVGRGRNRREEKQSALSHAETEAIREANAALGSWRRVAKAPLAAPSTSHWSPAPCAPGQS